MNPTILISASAAAALTLSFGIARAEIPAAIAAPGETLVMTLHAQGAQVYECKAEAAGKLAWVFREPIATLMLEGKTIGRHYGGPNWELVDGSIVAGKVAGRAPGATTADIPLLKLDAAPKTGGSFANVKTIQRLNTKGGVAEGSCEAAGALLSVPYVADYAFYEKPRWSLVSPSTTGENKSEEMFCVAC